MLLVITIVLFGRETSWGSAYHITDSVSDQIEFVGLVILVLIVISLGVYLSRQEHPLWSAAKQVACKLAQPVFFAATGIMLTANIFEKGYLGVDKSQFLEESYECIAYAIFLYGHILHIKKYLQSNKKIVKA